MLLLNGKQVKTGMFPNGESWVDKKLLDIKKNNSIGFRFRNDSSLVKLMFLKMYLDGLGVSSRLVVSYMPYSRMDRVNDDYLFSLKYVSSFINGLGFKSVTVVEPHSEVTPSLLNNCKAYYKTFDMLEDVIKEVGFDKDKDYLMFPDAGAQNRYSSLTGYNTLVANKERDFETGRIIKFDIIGEVEDKNSKVIVLDDLCCRGGTFMLSASKLKEKGLNEIYLLVGNCEDAIFDGDILKTDLIKKVFTTNGILTKKHEKITIV